jgi:hypothetical protein
MVYAVIKSLKIELTCSTKSPLAPLCPPGQRPYGPAAKEGYFPSLWKREVRRDFIK